MVYKQRKNIRFYREIYEEPGQIFSVTICTARRQQLFKNPALSSKVLEALCTGPMEEQVEIFAYCLMPDHHHLLIAPRTGNLIAIIANWKKYTDYLLRKAGQEGPFWQRGFYDHALRKDEDLVRAAEYLVLNPVRASLVDSWEDYRFSWHKWMGKRRAGTVTGPTSNVSR